MLNFTAVYNLWEAFSYRDGCQTFNFHNILNLEKHVANSPQAHSKTFFVECLDCIRTSHKHLTKWVNQNSENTNQDNRMRILSPVFQLTQVPRFERRHLVTSKFREKLISHILIICIYIFHQIRWQIPKSEDRQTVVCIGKYFFLN